MTQAPAAVQRYDRLTAFLQAFGLKAVAGAAAANLFVTRDAAGYVSHIVYRSRGGRPDTGDVLAHAAVDFGSGINPLLGALPDALTIALDDAPQIRALAELFVAENDIPRCGGATVRDRLCEVILVLVVRRAIALGAVDAGVLAGLAHPVLCPALVAMHDAPARAWRIETLAGLAGLSRSHFNALFARVVGQTPAAYLTSWRLAVGHVRLKAGASVKQVAAEVGFGSAAAFSRAFARAYGYPPVKVVAGEGPAHIGAVGKNPLQGLPNALA